MQLKHTSVTENSAKEIKQLRALNPSSMSWGSLPDEVPAVVLHHLARACAAPGKPHFMHSTAWVNDTQGSLLVDFRPIQTHRREAQQSLKDDAPGIRVERLIRTRPLENGIHVWDKFLAKRAAPVWLHVFAEIGARSGTASHEKLHAPKWVFQHSPSAIHFKMEYR